MPGIAFVLIFSAIFICGYSEFYPWPGPLKIPNDGRPFIKSGNVTVQLPKNRLERTVLIQNTVKMTFDCSPIVIRILEFSSIISNITTEWLVQKFDLNGTLASVSPVSYTTGIEIYGDNDRFLYIPYPSITSWSKYGNAGRYTCKVCYDTQVPFGLYPIRMCVNSSSTVDVIGDSPTIKRGNDPIILFMDIMASYRIGKKFCLEQMITFFPGIVCSQKEKIQPEPSAQFFLNGELITGPPSAFVLDVPSPVNEIGYSTYLLMRKVGLISAQIHGNILCNLTNRFGYDTEVSRVLLDPKVSSVSASLRGKSDNQCPLKSNAAVCPNPGDIVDIKCITKFADRYMIIGPNERIAMNQTLSFTVTEADTGDYTCTAINDCNTDTQTVRIESVDSNGGPGSNFE